MVPFSGRCATHLGVQDFDPWLFGNGSLNFNFVVVNRSDLFFSLDPEQVGHFFAEGSTATSLLLCFKTKHGEPSHCLRSSGLQAEIWNLGSNRCVPNFGCQVHREKPGKHARKYMGPNIYIYIYINIYIYTYIYICMLPADVLGGS